MNKQFLWHLLFSILLHPRFNQTGLDELVDTLHRYYRWLVCQRMLGANTKFHF